MKIISNLLYGFILLMNFGALLTIVWCLLTPIDKRYPLFTGKPALESPRSLAGKPELTQHKTLKTRHDGTDY